MSVESVPVAPTAVSGLKQILSQLEPTINRQGQSKHDPARSRQAQVFVEHFFKRVAAQDIAARSSDSWVALTLGLLDYLRVRQPGVPSVRVFNPTIADDGWESTHTVIQIVTDDSPFLVDSVGIAVTHAKLFQHVMIHPVYAIVRDPQGHMLDLGLEGRAG